MSKVIESPVERFPGTVTLPDDLDYLQGVTYITAYRQARELGKTATLVEFNHAMLPGICACVESVAIESWPEKLTPEKVEKLKPGKAVAEVMAWLFPEIAAIYARAEDIPNA